MKKRVSVLINLALICVMFNPTPKAFANLEVVMGPLGPQVVTNFAPPASFGPTVGGPNGGTVGGVGGSYAVVDANGNVTNTIVCHSFCANGTFGPGGDTVVLQIPNSNVGVWFGPSTTTYDRQSQTFTAVDPITQKIEMIVGDSTKKVDANKTLTFKSGEIYIDSDGNLAGVDESWTVDYWQLLAQLAIN